MKSIRHQYTLPGKFRIKVVWLTDSVFNKRGYQDSWAWWEDSRRSIYMRKSRKGADALDDFMHEMEHAVADWRDWFRVMMKDELAK